MVRLRKVKDTDIDLLYKWANDPIVRKNSFNTDIIKYETHKVWFYKMMTSTSIHQFILVNDEIPLGQIRLNIISETAEIGYSIAAEFRGMGYGSLMLKLINDELKNNYPNVKKIIAKVKTQNIASQKAFEKMNYEKEYLSYSLVLK
ncbi:MAG: GNAT family N-acetyltransferase [Lachnospiraceae bacterium]|nr:GNAT family N-acetyltransferase [Lachnospiraceae bacterium]